MRFLNLLREAEQRLNAAGARLGGTLRGLGFLPVTALFGSLPALAISSTHVVICTRASVVGAILPMAARRIGLAPVTVNRPLVPRLVDATGLVVHGLLARAILGA